MDQLLAQLEWVIKNHHSIAFAASFAAGLISAASPCVLAAIPLVIGYVGGYSDGNRKKAALFSLVFVIGLSLTFTLFGVAASAVGRLLGVFGNWLYGGLALTAILMGLQLVGLIAVPMPIRRHRSGGMKGLWGAFILGVVTGTVSSPCATPVLAVILAYVATEGNVLYGGVLLFIYSIGHCALIFSAGLSMGIAESLVNSRRIKNISLYAKQLSGVIMMGVGVYLIYYIIW